ncbi:histidine kinase [Pilimelia terevasa]|uniref:histidine kinase n=1 Tax=Pilimelia terevasa TaxID=53372 RepID=A0A8J3BUW5_9ACTN|nr:PAS domain S-box protein [Pilimelia terevasa]GGK42212.1 histidine kinase [Pilimelia terevasa]
MVPPEPDPAAQELLASIVRSSHDAIVALDLELTILSWNRGAERLYGYPAAEAVGRPADLLVPAERRADIAELVRRVATGARIDRFRTRLRRRGRHLTVSLAVSPLTDLQGRIVGVTTIARDISDGERAEARLGAVLDAAPDAIIAVDRRGRVVLANSRAERLFDRTLPDLLGRDVDTLVPGGLVGGGGDCPVATHAVRRDGAPVPVELTLSVTDTDEGPLRCAALRDISDRLRAQAEQQRLRAIAERDRMDAQLQRAQRWESLGQLAGGVAHDFNNLVGVILSYGEFVIEQASTGGDLATIAADAQQLVDAAQRASDLTHQLLSFARREVVRAEPLDLHAVIEGLLDLLRRSVGEHIAVRVRTSGDLPPVVADRGQLQQLLANLAVNARDAMPGGGSLTLRTDTVVQPPSGAPGGPPPGEYVRLRVADTGSGMPQEVRDRAFEPFFTTKPRSEGTGLGLATVYGIVTQAGGDVRIESAVGAGTTIVVLLPVAVDPAPAETAPPVAARGETILLVEDDPALRGVAARTLRGAGYDVLLAADGTAALEVAREHPGPIQLLVSDVVLPGMQGKELAARLAVTRPGARVLYVSGYTRPVLTSRGTLEGDQVLLAKPFTRDELLRAVRLRLDAPE